VSGHSWQPFDLVAAAARPPEPPTIGGLLYPAKRTLLSGETEALKTWLALILAKAEMDAGHAVAWADLDAMGSAEILARLRALGVDDETTSRLFLYFEPTETLKQGRLEDFCALLAERDVRLAVLDAFNPMLSLHGLDPSSTPDVEAFWREIATPITTAGAAPTLLDHVAKNPDGRGKYAYGSERKASGAIVHIGFRSLDPLARGTTGRSLLTTHKDRPGYLPRPTIGRLVLTSDGENISYTLEADRSRAGNKFRPSVLMERVSRTLEQQSESVSQTWIEKNISGKVVALRQAVEVLVEEGYLTKTEMPAPRGWQIVSARPYREDADPVLEYEEEIASLSRPYRVPELVSVTPDPIASPRPPSKRDGVAYRSATASLDRVPSPSLPVWTDADVADELALQEDPSL
jgi:AAA domain